MKISSSIIMGDDEFILYIRKNYPTCDQYNNILARQISEWFKEKDIEPYKRDVPCTWDIVGETINDRMLPKTSATFKFDRSLLPELFSQLDELGKKNQYVFNSQIT